MYRHEVEAILNESMQSSNSSVDASNYFRLLQTIKSVGGIFSIPNAFIRYLPSVYLNTILKPVVAKLVLMPFEVTVIVQMQIVCLGKLFIKTFVIFELLSIRGPV